MPTPRRAASPHGLLGYVVADADRTRNALRLLRWSLAGATVLLPLVIGTLVVLAHSPPHIAWLCSGAAATGTLWRALRTSRRQ
ncbi:hypothetical protein [Actinokineospora diospyrosa]|uniref:Uncharacterized protein n=1 Tax=Actinokineospora diospyrosa TaxID=103728 RepID=A0ABT1ICF1_9PSEU|nr:hypothetical protein [Actinokineospora diospyrosa]MCP2270243.1 hypothetical protein [Actinokineospora diospyrosa]